MPDKGMAAWKETYVVEFSPYSPETCEVNHNSRFVGEKRLKIWTEFINLTVFLSYSSDHFIS